MTTSKDADELRRPSVAIEIVRDESRGAPGDRGFLRLRRLVLQNRYADGTKSREYRYDCVERDAIDAVGILLVDGEGRVCLRSSIRPPLSLRPGYALPLRAEETGDPTLFEIPAGLVEPSEVGEAGLRECCARETMEEVGLEVSADAFSRLGVGVYLSPGLVAEKLHVFVATVDPSRAVAPTMDGSPVEERAAIVWLPLEEALAACDDGRVCDVKTEIALLRLARQQRSRELRARPARDGGGA